MISAILSILGSSTVGSLLGGIFAFLNRKVDVQVKAMELAQQEKQWNFELLKKDKDLLYAQQEAQSKKEVTIIEADASIEQARMTAIAAAQVSDRTSAEEIKAAGSLGWIFVLVSAANKSVRPVATVILAACAIGVNFILMHRLADSWSSLTPVQQYDAAMQAFAWITGQASAALGYWFVARGSSTQGK